MRNGVHCMGRFLRRRNDKLRRKRSRPSVRVEPLTERGFRIVGDLDIFNVATVRKALKPELHGTLVLDLSEVEFMDDSGLGFLAGALKQIRAGNGTLVLRNARPEILRVLEVTGLSRVPGITVESKG